ncbi:I78 family peptidase inhibitor [Streptomyces sp. NBC_01511]|uniref:I78 family peptidase inhibitor n=1 Tax=unclassified Streptomyces TaxID=2593676 RepID=UPI00386402C5
MASIPTPPAQPDDTPDSYVGLAAPEAGRIARERGWTTVRALPPGAIITLEYLRGRLNFEVENDTVVRCWLG